MRLPLSIASLLVVLAATPSARAVPTITVIGPNEVDEGQEVAIIALIEDPEGDFTWSWDVDGDGTYGEAAGEVFIAFPADETDGPTTITLGVEAIGPTATVTASHRLQIRNIAPTITGEPPTSARVRVPYRYDVTVSEPAAADELNVRLTSRPMGMELEGTVVTWMPEPDQRGRTFPVILRASDDDGGEATQTWNVTVAQNAAPPPPRPVAPVMRARVAEGAPFSLVVENAEDPDGDPLQYRFRLSRTFDFADAIEIPPVVASADTETRAEVGPFDRGHWYWEVVSDDTMERSAPVYGQLVIGEDAPFDADAGPRGPGGGGGGCAVGRGSNAWWLAMLAPLLLWRRRAS